MRKKVAVILPYFGNGGAENMVAHLVSHINLNKVNMQVYCIFGKPLRNHLEKEVQEHGVKIIFIGKKLGFSIKAVFNLYKELNKFDPDIVHTHLMGCMYATPWVFFHKVKMLHTLHSIPEAENRNIIRRLTTKFLYKIKKAIPVAISEENKKLISEYYNLKLNSVEVVNNPVITLKYYHNENSKKVMTLITVGRLSKEKNQQMLIQAFYEVKKVKFGVRLVIVGDGVERKRLEEKVHSLELDDSVTFVGNVTDVENYLCNADIFLLSSLYEGIPLAILEAMAAKLPIIATNVGGIKDIVTNNGILVPSENIEEMKKAILKLVENPKLIKEMGLNSLLNVKKYDINNIVKNYTILYEKYSIERNGIC